MGNPSSPSIPRPRGAAGNAEDSEVVSCRGKDNWANEHKPCHYLFEGGCSSIETEKSLKDTGILAGTREYWRAHGVIVEEAYLSQNGTDEMDLVGQILAESL